MKKQEKPIKKWTKWQKIMVWGSFSFLALVILIVVISTNEDKKSNIKNVTDSTAVLINTHSVESDSLEVVKKIDSLIPTINLFIREHQDVYSRSDADDLLSKWHDLSNAFYSTDIRYMPVPSSKNEIETIEEYQKTIFPKLRLAFYKDAKEKLWEKDIYVSVAGKRNEFIIFMSDDFYTNKNIKEFQDEIKDVLYKYRFKKTGYARDKDGYDPQALKVFGGEDEDIY